MALDHSTCLRMLREFEIISKKVIKTFERGQDIQKDMAVIMLLHYLNEIKDFFIHQQQDFCLKYLLRV
jgi:hypothetical protein